MLHVFKRSYNTHITLFWPLHSVCLSNLRNFWQTKHLKFYFKKRNHFRDRMTRLVINTRLFTTLKSVSMLKIIEFSGGLSLHLNHLIASRVTNYDWPFGTLPFGLLWSNLDTRDLETYPRTYSGHFWNMSLFRWFKFTLKPPYSIARGKLQLAIWDTSFWFFWLKFGHKGPWDIS